MNIRCRTLWRVPVFCSAASIVCYYLTLYLGGFFFSSAVTGANGVTELSIDPVRSAIFHGVLFFAVLLLGGLWAFRSMTKAELAVSCGILSGLYLGIHLAQLYWPGFPSSLGFVLAPLQNWSGTIASWLHQITGNLPVSVLLADAAPFLFVPFGRKSAK